MASRAEPRLGASGPRTVRAGARAMTASCTSSWSATGASSALPASSSIAAVRSTSTCSGTSARPGCATSRLRSTSRRRPTRSTPQSPRSRRPCSHAGRQHVECCPRWRNVNVSPDGSGWRACCATSTRAPARCWSTATSPESNVPTSLPRGRRQVAGVGKTGRIYRDVAYRLPLVVELDGRLFHDSTSARDRDFDRDLLAQVDGQLTTRLAWGQVFDRPCWTAAQVGVLLQQRGWTGAPKPCGAIARYVVDRTHQVKGIHHARRLDEWCWCPGWGSNPH